MELTALFLGPVGYLAGLFTLIGAVYFGCAGVDKVRDVVKRKKGY